MNVYFLQNDYYITQSIVLSSIMNMHGANPDEDVLIEYIKHLRDKNFILVRDTYLKFLQDAQLPLFAWFAHLSSEALLDKIGNSLLELFDDIINQKFLENSANKISKWKANLISDVPYTAVQITDIVIINSIRKQIFLTFLPSFNKDSKVTSAVMIAVERLFMESERLSLEAYMDIQQQDLAERKEFFSTLIENSINGVMVLDTKMTVTEWNPVMEKDFNVSRKDALGQKIFSLFPSTVQSQTGFSLAESLQSNERIISRDIQFSLDGGWYDIFTTPLYFADDGIKGMLVIFHDITVRKKIEFKLQEHKEELQAINEELLDQQEELKKANVDLQINYEQLFQVMTALKENEARLLEAQSIAHLGSWEYDIQNNKIYWSDEMRRIFGYNAHEALDYETYLSLLHPEDVDHINSIVSETIKTLKPYSFEHRIIRKDGSIRYLIANGRAITSADGELVKLQGTALDITALKLVELEKEDNQYFIKKITETTPDIITVFDLAEKKNIYTNRAFYEMLGYSQGEADLLRDKKLEGLKELLHPDDFPRILTFFTGFENYLGDDTRELEFRIRHKDNSWVWICSRYKIFKKSAEGKVVQLIGVSKDITNKKLAEAKIKENEGRLKDSQVLAQLGYWEMDIESKDVYWSEHLFRIYGIPSQQSLKVEEIKSYILPEDQKILTKKMETAIATGDSYQLQYKILRSGNEVRHINTKGEVIRNNEGKIIKLRGIAQDVTERKVVDQKLHKAYEELKITHEDLKKSEEALRSLNNELENRVLKRTMELQTSNDRLVRKNTDLDNFIYTASHDLKVPIANIEGLLNILKKKVDDKLQDNDKIILNMMEESVGRFNTTIKDLTQISKIQKDLEEENSEKISIAETLNDLLQDIAGLIAEKNSKIYTNFEVKEIFFTKKNLRSILYNLIVNSLKYSVEDRTPEIKISTCRTSEGVTLSVSDNGMGIPENQLGKIFSLFKRYHTKIEGSGIGLYIVKRMIENSGGRVEVKSEVNKGTTFNLIFTYKS